MLVRHGQYTSRCFIETDKQIEMVFGTATTTTYPTLCCREIQVSLKHCSKLRTLKSLCYGTSTVAKVMSILFYRRPSSAYHTIIHHCVHHTGRSAAHRGSYDLILSSLILLLLLLFRLQLDSLQQSVIRRKTTSLMFFRSESPSFLPKQHQTIYY